MAAIAANLTGGAATAIYVEQALAAFGQSLADGIIKGLSNKFAQSLRIFIAQVNYFGLG